MRSSERELSAVNTPSRLSLELLEKVQMNCKLCSRLVFAEDADKHLKSKCTAHTISSLGLSDIMKLPIATPLNDSEKKIGNCMVRRMIAGKTTPVPISTGGPFSYKAYYMYIYIHVHVYTVCVYT